MCYRFKTEGETDTMMLGEGLGQALDRPFLMILTGELGAGKTTFVQGLGRGLALEEDATSPSFTLLRIYRGRMDVYHFDFYRLEDIGELQDLDLDEYFYGRGITVIEWGDRFPSILPEAYLEVNLAADPEKYNHRVITFRPRGEYARRLVRELREKYAGFGD